MSDPSASSPLPHTPLPRSLSISRSAARDETASDDQPDSSELPANGSPRNKTKALRRLSKTLGEAEVPLGFTAATALITASTINTLPRVLSPETSLPIARELSPSSEHEDRGEHPAGRSDAFPNGYHFPPRYPLKASAARLPRALWHYLSTPVGIFVVVYSLLLVGWGGMLFLILCNAAPAMCQPNCNDINSPRRIWVEYDSQILNALFCVTGFGLAPWRLRDLVLLLLHRTGPTTIRGSKAIRRLAAIHRGWFRLPGSQHLPPKLGPSTVHLPILELENISAIPLPEKRIPNRPLTGVRALQTSAWKLDLVIWAFFANSLLQIVICVFMWHWDRYTRPVWAVGMFVGLGLIAAALGGLMIFFESNKIKKIEGVALTREDVACLTRDRELGITHYNNIEDKKAKVEKRCSSSVLAATG